mmetsp:Transcript_13299/g.24985  ORF Transcript_13299/g.24985 Transcript_13299/m.24985 type:complete len:338 (-) Transcript_13299:2492-3505(-)
MKHFSTPAWSLGGRFKEGEKFQTPAPSSYEVREDPNQVGTYHIGKGPRGDLVQANGYPGPGSYEVPGSFRGRSKDSKGRYNKKEALRDKNTKSKVDNPGPGTYNPVPVRSATSYSFGNKTYALPAAYAENDPGPGNYEPNFKYNATTRNWKIGQAEKGKLDSQAVKVPGPGAYDGKLHDGVPKYGFSKGPREIKSASEAVPGPGAYEMPSVRNTMSKSITGRQKPPKDTSISLGPGAYNPKLQDKAPEYKIGTGKREDFSKAKKLPGPGQYDPKLAAQVSKATSFGRGTRPPINSTQDIPGPGSYEHKETIGAGTAITMVGRKAEEKKLMNVPVSSN